MGTATDWLDELDDDGVGDVPRTLKPLAPHYYLIPAEILGLFKAVDKDNAELTTDQIREISQDVVKFLNWLTRELYEDWANQNPEFPAEYKGIFQILYPQNFMRITDGYNLASLNQSFQNGSTAIEVAYLKYLFLNGIPSLSSVQKRLLSRAIKHIIITADRTPEDGVLEFAVQNARAESLAEA